MRWYCRPRRTQRGGARNPTSPAGSPPRAPSFRWRRAMPFTIRPRRMPRSSAAARSEPSSSSRSADPRWALGATCEMTALDRYIATPDPTCHWQLVETVPGDGYCAHLLALTSQRWRNEAEVDRPLWRHWLTVIVPQQVMSGIGLVMVAGGSNEK